MCKVFPAMPCTEVPCPLRIMIAGSVCKDFSSMGNMQALGGPYMKIFNVWAAEVLFVRPHVVVHEITLLAPDDLLEATIGHLYNITVFHLDPVQLGWPVSRPR
eukprot:5867331-Lingulodinium_polyedra.AAC.1